MTTQPQPNSDLSQIARLVEGMSVAMLTSAARDGGLVSRPMAPLEMDTEGALWFFTDARTEAAEQLGAVNLSFSDEAQAIYVSIAGRASVVRDREQIARLWTPLARPWFPDGPNAEHLVLLKVEPDVVDYWDAPHSKMVRLVAMAASMMAGRPIGLGEHSRQRVPATARVAKPVGGRAASQIA